MKHVLKILTLIVISSLIKNYGFSQINNSAKKYVVNDFIAVDKIKGIEIYNTWNRKRWTLNEKDLALVKTILNRSSVTKYLVVKPGHLYIKFLGLDFKNYDTYMYDEEICFDPYYDKTTLKQIKGTHPFSILLNEKIDWEKLR